MKLVKLNFLIFLLIVSENLISKIDKTCKGNTIFKIGTGIYDITGPAAEQGMMGYAMLDQKTAGILQRLWARAFIIESPCNNNRIVIVNADLGQLFQGVKQEVIKKLKAKYGNKYTEKNVLLTANHQHSGPGGYSTYALYNLSTLGFNKKNFNTIVDGIVNAIERAEKNLSDGQIRVAQRDLRGTSFNRSPSAYLENPEDERKKYFGNTNNQMILLRFDADNKPVGMINWFAVHGTSMNNRNKLINGDNKGYAEYLFEKYFKSNHGPKAFVAAFAQSDSGDVSPNKFKSSGGEGEIGRQKVSQSGLAQYKKAKSLFDNARETVIGGVDYRHAFVKMDEVEISPEFTSDNTIHKTCPAAIGVSMLAGTQDGEGLGKQGVTCNEVNSLFANATCKVFTTECQGDKPIAIQTGKMKPNPWTPNILPLQIFKIGDVVIIGIPFEVTTMAGRRLRNALKKELEKINVNHIILACLSNAYTGYITTPEEYKLQLYEGASNHFGPWTLEALIQEYTKLAKSMVENKKVEDGPKPPYLVDSQINLQTEVVFDDKPIRKNFGSIHEDAKKEYEPGGTVKVTFWGAHPKNDYRIQDTFLKVQELKDGKWETIRTDHDWDTEYHWKRHGAASSQVTVVWRIPKNVQPGKYRIGHYGNWKSGWTHKVSPYEGYSSEFEIK